MYQELTIVGTMGKDPEMRYTADGKAMANISVATNRNTAKGGRETTWFRVTCYEKTAEYMNTYSQKGSKIIVRGRLIVDPNTGGPRVFTRNDGTASSAFEVAAETVKVISGYKSAEGEQPQQQTQRSQPQQTSYTEVDDIPW